MTNLKFKKVEEEVAIRENYKLLGDNFYTNFGIAKRQKAATDAEKVNFSTYSAHIF